MHRAVLKKNCVHCLPCCIVGTSLPALSVTTAGGPGARCWRQGPGGRRQVLEAGVSKRPQKPGTGGRKLAGPARSYSSRAALHTGPSPAAYIRHSGGPQAAGVQLPLLLQSPAAGEVHSGSAAAGPSSRGRT